MTVRQSQCNKLANSESVPGSGISYAHHRAGDCRVAVTRRRYILIAVEVEQFTSSSCFWYTAATASTDTDLRRTQCPITDPAAGFVHPRSHCPWTLFRRPTRLRRVRIVWPAPQVGARGGLRSGVRPSRSCWTSVPLGPWPGRPASVAALRRRSRGPTDGGASASSS